jgi:AmmeMemoRadiSam system protein B
LPNPIVAGIVPHAGWTFSGDLAGSVFAAVRQVNGPVDTFILFGAAHRYYSGPAAVYDKGDWETPLGLIRIDEDLAAKIAALDGAAADPQAHRAEHSIEVQVPFIQHLFPDAKIVPIIVPPEDFSPAFGAAVGRMLAALKNKKAVAVASTDLTHYGPRYGFCPAGIGRDALTWAHQVNDMEFIQHALQMDAEQIVPIALEKQNACGPAAAAAAVAAAKAMGAVRGVLIGHTNSCDVMRKKYRQTSEESVGYAGIVF